jgi:peptide/nickel transport system ATP-binding protein
VSAAPLLAVEELAVEIRGEEGVRTVVDGLSFGVAEGEVLAIAGESGSGKSLTALALMGLLPQPAARVAGGRALFLGDDLLALPEREMRRRRGGGIAMVFQEPMTSLNPIMRVGGQIFEAIRIHDPAADPRRRAIELLAEVGVPEPASRLGQYPHELSGGQRQRVMIAMALAGRPRLLIADEPTTALDVTVQAQVLDLLRDLQRRTGVAVILITHDMGVVAEMATRVLVMQRGRKVEEAPVRRLFAAPEAAYTRELLDAVPRLGSTAGLPDRGLPAGPPVCEVRGLTVSYARRGGLLRRAAAGRRAVNGVGFRIGPGETLALVGESGCGKSTTGRALLNLIPWEGDIRVMGRPTRGLRGAAMRPVLRQVQMVFQDPYASLDPRMSVGDLVAEPLAIHGVAGASERRDRVAELLRRVGLAPEHMRRHPHEFSGGQRQRICIARALALEPRLIVADESVSALDVSVKARILALLAELQATLGLSYLFISHDLAVVEQISDRVAVMLAGRIVEVGSRRQLFGDARHPYTRRLLAAAPVPDPERPRRPPADAAPLPPPLPLREVSPGHCVEA